MLELVIDLVFYKQHPLFYSFHEHGVLNSKIHINANILSFFRLNIISLNIPTVNLAYKLYCNLFSSEGRNQVKSFIKKKVDEYIKKSVKCRNSSVKF